jgi:hypothetical protein
MRKNWTLFCAGWIGATLLAVTVASGAEPKCQCPAAPPPQEAGVPLFSRIPYLSRLFKNVVPASDCQCPGQVVERIGIDFDCACPEWAGQPQFECFEFRVHPAGHFEAHAGEGLTGECHKGICRLVACEEAAACGDKCTAKCAAKCGACTDCKCTAEGCCQSCSGSKECCCTSKQCGAAGQCSAEKACCCEKACGKSGCPCQVAVAKCPCTGATANVVKFSHPACGCGKKDVALWERIIELTAEKSAAEAAVAAHEESAELTESLVELVAENASLAAQVEAQEHRQEAFEEMIALVKENAELKAKVELAAAQTELLKQTIHVAIENERLKLRIAHLEGHSGEQAAHTAAKPEQQPTR